MRYAAIASVLIFVGLATASQGVHAERVKQWVAPPECVIDAGLPTQYILSEQECYDLLNPPVDPGDNGGTDGGGSGTGTDIKRPRSKAYIPIVFLPQINSPLSKPLIEGQKSIVIDRPANQRSGLEIIIALCIIYALLGIFIVIKKLRQDPDDE